MYIIFTENEDLANLAKEIGEKVITQFDKDIEKSVSDVLLSLGIPSNIKGFNYLKYTIYNLITDVDFDKDGILNGVYPTLAKTFHSNYLCVERAIRYAIEVSFNRGPIELHKKIFGNSIDIDKVKTTNSEFIYGIKTYVEGICYLK